MEYNIQALLQNLGLTKTEIRVYLKALEVGEVSITQLAKHAAIHRVEAYAIVDKLLERGLLQQSVARHGKTVWAKHPRELNEIIKRDQRRLKKIELKYEELLPDLAALYKGSGFRPRVQFFEGIHGLEQMNADIIATLKELPKEKRITYSYSNPDAVAKRFADYLYEEGGYVDKRKQYGIVNRVIAPNSKIVQAVAKRNTEELREMLVVPPELFPFKNDITIYDKKMAIQALGHELIGVVIESQEMIEDQLAIFNLAWLGAHKITMQK